MNPLLDDYEFRDKEGNLLASAALHDNEAAENYAQQIADYKKLQVFVFRCVADVHPEDTQPG